MDVFVFDPSAGGVEFSRDNVVAWIAERIDRAPIFRQRLLRVPGDLDHPYWVPDPGFDVAAHVSVTAATGPGWEPLRRTICDISDGPVALTRPPWELHLITDVVGIDDLPDGAGVAVLKFHHAVGDATETVRLGRLLLMPDRHPADGAAGREATGAGLSRAGALGAAVRRGPHILARYLSGTVQVRRDGRRAAAVAERSGVEAAPQTWPATRFNRPLTSAPTFGRVLFALPEIKAAQSKVPGATVNDVAMCVISGAMARYLSEAGETPDGSLGARVPRSTRTIRERQSGNRFSVLSVDLHTGVADPVRRLGAIQASASAAKDRMASAERQSVDVLEILPVPYLKLALGVDRRRNRAGSGVPGGNTLISNVGRGAGDLQLCGAPVVDGYGILPIAEGAGLSHFVASIADRLTITFTVDEEMMPNPDRYAQFLSASFAELAANGELPVSQG